MESGKKYGCRETPVPPLGLGHWSHRNSTSGLAVCVQGKTAPERISQLVLRGQTPPRPQPRRRGPPSQPCLSPSLSLPGLLICQGSSLRCGLCALEPSSAGCHGDAKHCHLPIPVPAVGQHGAQAAGLLWGKFGAQHVSCRTALGRILHPPSPQRSHKQRLSAGRPCSRFRELLELERWGKEVLG